LQARIAIRFGSALHGWGNPSSSHGEWVVMDNLRWWLLLIAAVMFSMSGCASARDVAAPAAGDDRVVSARDGGDEAAHDQGADEPAMDLSGRWVGTWKGLGLFDSLRLAPAEATFVQQGVLGIAHLRLENTIAAGVPWVMRLEGARGVRLVYRVSGPDAVLRHPATPSQMTAAFTLVDGKLVGTLPNPDGPVVVTLTRRDK